MSDAAFFERKFHEAIDELMEHRYALARVRCFAAIADGRRCTRSAWLSRKRRPVCSQHSRAKVIRFAVQWDDATPREERLP